VIRSESIDVKVKKKYMVSGSTHQKRIHRLLVTGSELFQDFSDFMSFAPGGKGKRQMPGGIKIHNHRLLNGAWF
jgi:hypothetical protein